MTRPQRATPDRKLTRSPEPRRGPLWSVEGFERRPHPLERQPQPPPPGDTSMSTAMDWTDYGIYRQHNLPTDWQHVVTIDEGGYEWATLHAFYSPTARRFYWHDGAGCSCNSWGEDIVNVGDFQDGTRADLERALREFMSEHEYMVSASSALDAIAELRRWRKP